jgi:hypothetical protein
VIWPFVIRIIVNRALVNWSFVVKFIVIRAAFVRSIVNGNLRKLQLLLRRIVVIK